MRRHRVSQELTDCGTFSLKRLSKPLHAAVVMELGVKKVILIRIRVEKSASAERWSGGFVVCGLCPRILSPSHLTLLRCAQSKKNRGMGGMMVRSAVRFYVLYDW